MPLYDEFDLPANINDLESSQDQSAMRTYWNDIMRRFTQKTLQNDPWSSINQPELTQYFDPTVTDAPPDDNNVLSVVSWTAFPRRIDIEYGQESQTTRWEYADNGPPAEDGYEPEGPRGWQDEYCEWSVTRREGDGKITKVSFTCENREYWYALWAINPETVLGLYRQLVGDQVELEDLYLYDDDNQVIYDRETGRPAYNDRNEWNRSTSGGSVVHLICTPNALFDQVFIAGQATVLREDAAGNPITDNNALINCSLYGQANRNSDPTIGGSVNGLVRDEHRVTLHNPVGLYIQNPNFSNYELPLSAPSDAQASDYWTIVRGTAASGDEGNDEILHAVFEVPEDQGFTVGDITINGFPIEYGSQIAETFQIALVGSALSRVGSEPEILQCAGEKTPALPKVTAVNSLPMVDSNLRSNMNMRIEPGQTVTDVGVRVKSASANVEVSFEGSGVSVQVNGDSTPQDAEGYVLLNCTIAADADASLGDYAMLAIEPDSATNGPSTYGLVTVVPQGTLAKDV